MKTLLAIFLLIPSLSWGNGHSKWKKSSMNLTQVLQIQDAEIVHIERVKKTQNTDTWMYHIRDEYQFFICNLTTVIDDTPRESVCYYEDWSE